jgi:hypothetical protein
MVIASAELWSVCGLWLRHRFEMNRERERERERKERSPSKVKRDR